MKYYIFTLFTCVLLSTLSAQERNFKPLKVSAKLSVSAYNPGISGEIYYHINNQSAFGFEVLSFKSKQKKHEPNSGSGFGPDLNLPYEGFSQTINSYLLKYQIIPEPNEPTFFQMAFSGGVGLSYFNEVVDYVKQPPSSGSGGMGFFSPVTLYDEIRETHTSLTGMLGFNAYKRKSTIGFLFGIDVFFTEHQVSPLLKTGMQINFFKKQDKSNKN